MSKLKSTILRFPASGSPDVVTYKIYLEEGDAPVGYDSPSFDIGKNEVDFDGVPHIEADLSGINGMTTMDGVYNVGVVAVDDAGNESSMSKLDAVPLDFQAPDPPGPLSFVSG